MSCKLCKLETFLVTTDHQQEVMSGLWTGIIVEIKFIPRNSSVRLELKLAFIYFLTLDILRKDIHLLHYRV